MNSRAYLILFLFALWSLGSGWYYVCKIKQKCNNSTKVAQTKQSFSFDWNSEKPNTTTDFGVFKEDILNKLGTTNALNIVGKYAIGEINNSAFDNLGLARAAAIRTLFPEIDDSRFVLGSKQVDGVSAQSTVEGAEINVLIKNEFIEQTEFGAVIHYPADTKETMLTPEVLEYLDLIVAKFSNNDIDIVGHTDNKSKNNDHFSLGMERASAIKDELIAKGMPVEKINVVSKGETEPLADNAAEEGRSRNRRVEIIIND
ncbi:MAG: hypothetical protein RLZZ337_1934 [Bacteroidota bacterium]|jgi:outer membrane protein OmpA-like peptidoglycan-associated protein